MEETRTRRKPGPKPKQQEIKRPDPSNRSGRVRRSSVNSGRDRLNVSGSPDPNYVYRTVNDEGSRIEEMKSFGYDIVENEDVNYSSANKIGVGKARTVVVDRRTGKKGVLMRQPKEYHDEDAAAKEALLKEKEKSMFRLLKTEDGRYGEVENTNSLAKAIED